VKISSIEVIPFEPRWDDPFAPKRRTLAALKVHTDAGLGELFPRSTPISSRLSRTGRSSRRRRPTSRRRFGPTSIRTFGSAPVRFT
jgi:hypothetical protein